MECKDHAFYYKDGLPICSSCEKALAKSEVKRNRISKYFSLAKAIYTGIVVLIVIVSGLDLILDPPSPEHRVDQIVSFWAVSGFLGFPVYLVYWLRQKFSGGGGGAVSSSSSVIVATSPELAMGWMYGSILGIFLSLILFFVIAIVSGPFCVIWSFIKNVRKTYYSNKNLRYARKVLGHDRSVASSFAHGCSDLVHKTVLIVKRPSSAEKSEIHEEELKN